MGVSTITFEREGSTASSAVLNFSVGGTATFTTDYTVSGATSYSATTGSVTFAAGDSTKVITITTVGDAIAEANETIVLTLTGSVPVGSLSSLQGVVVIVIRDDDFVVTHRFLTNAAGNITLTTGTVNGTLGTLAFTNGTTPPSPAANSIYQNSASFYYYRHQTSVSTTAQRFLIWTLIVAAPPASVATGTSLAMCYVGYDPIGASSGMIANRFLKWVKKSNGNFDIELRDRGTTGSAEPAVITASLGYDIAPGSWHTVVYQQDNTGLIGSCWFNGVAIDSSTVAVGFSQMPLRFDPFVPVGGLLCVNRASGYNPSIDYPPSVI